VAGECYARVEIPARYETTQEKVLTREAHQRLLVQPPQLETHSEQVMVKEPSVRYVVRQPTYATVTEKVLTRPAYDKLSVSEPQFQTVTETVKKGRSRLVWKRGHPATLRAQGYIIHSTADGGVGGKGYTSTQDYGNRGGQRCGTACEIWCLVEEPGESVTVTRQVMTQPGQLHRTSVPAQYETITKQVVTDPGGVKKIPIPAEYRNLQVQKLVRPGATATVDVPAEYGHVNGRRLVSEARYEWRRIACKPAVGSAYSKTQTSQTITRGQPVVTRSYGTSSSSQHTQVQAGSTVRYAPVTDRLAAPTAGSQTKTVTTHRTFSSSQPAYHGTYVPSTGTTPPRSNASRSEEYVERSMGAPEWSYQGPAYAIPHTGESHPYAVRPGAPKRRRR
jgi:hypothetical protein